MSNWGKENQTLFEAKLIKNHAGGYTLQASLF
jgi:hypothetical protein